MYQIDVPLKSVARAGDRAVAHGSPQTTVAFGYDFTGRVWRLDTADWSVLSVSLLAAHTNAVSSVAWNGDEPVTGGWDSRVLRWSPLPGEGGYAPHELTRATLRSK